MSSPNYESTDRVPCLLGGKYSQPVVPRHSETLPGQEAVPKLNHDLGLGNTASIQQPDSHLHSRRLPGWTSSPDSWKLNELGSKRRSITIVSEHG